MPKRLGKYAIIATVSLLASACATNGSAPQMYADKAPWWEAAGPCRIWTPTQPQPGRMPAWDRGPSTTRMSNPGDCRALQAVLPDGAMLIGSD